MAIIKQLPLDQAYKIAAGEVIERPANIVKELIENSLDAGATHVKIMIVDGGKELIRIIDNGSGMDEEDARLCFNKHATSKITSIDDLDSVATFGFRGEALASVAAVAHVTLVTKHTLATHGTKVVVEHNAIISQEIVAASQGTDISVANLFYALPARKKFLKKKETEWRQILLLFQAFCFDYPAIHFQLHADGKIVHNCPSVTNLQDRITQLLNHEVGTHMLAVEHVNHQYTCSIDGIISRHDFHRYDSSGIFFFVNNRWVKNHSLMSALMKGYHNVLPHGKYPLCALMITVQQHDVDINIHPRKEEVKFIHPRIIEQLIQDSVRMALEARLSQEVNVPVRLVHSAPSNSYNRILSTERLLEESLRISSIAQEPFASIKAAPSYEAPLSIFNSSAYIQSLPKQSSLPDRTIVMHENQAPDYQIIGQYHKTYIVIEKEDGLFFVDQHAAHERILYENFKIRFKESAHIQLLFPQIIALSSGDLGLIEQHMDLLSDNNILVESFGAQQLRVTATPIHLQSVPLDDLIKQIIGWLRMHEHDDQDQLLKIHEKIHAHMACKAAIKAGDVLSKEHMMQLLRDLDKTRSNFCCPHGRPTGWLLPLSEIEKKFKRDYRSS